MEPLRQYVARPTTAATRIASLPPISHSAISINVTWLIVHSGSEGYVPTYPLEGYTNPLLPAVPQIPLVNSEIISAL